MLSCKEEYTKCWTEGSLFELGAWVTMLYTFGKPNFTEKYCVSAIQLTSLTLQQCHVSEILHGFLHFLQITYPFSKTVQQITSLTPALSALSELKDCKFHDAIRKVLLLIK